MIRNIHRPGQDGPRQHASDAIRPVPDATIPYWRSEIHRLDEYRSSQELPAESDIVIIGAGMSGVTFAYHLLNLYGDEEAKPSITILEARQVCSGATGRNGGHVKMKTSTLHELKRLHGVQVADHFAAYTNGIIHGIKAAVEKENLDCEFELRRSFDVFIDAQTAQEQEESFRTSVADGDQWLRDRDFIPGDRVEQVTSVKGAKAAISVPCCSLWPYKFVTQLLERIIEHVNLQTNTPVTEVCSRSDGEAATGQQQQPTVKTSRGAIRARKVIFASNAYTSGICPRYRDHIVPIRATAAHLRPRAPVAPHLTQTYNLAYAPHQVDYLNPRPDGGIVVGGAKAGYVANEALWYNVWDDSRLLPGALDHFDALMQRHFRGWAESGCGLDDLWTGIIGITSDGMPHVGPVPGSAEGSQYVIAGFNGGGMAMIFSAALGLARMVKDRVPFPDTGMPTLFEPSTDRLSRPVCALDHLE